MYNIRRINEEGKEQKIENRRNNLTKKTTMTDNIIGGEELDEEERKTEKKGTIPYSPFPSYLLIAACLI